MKLKVAKNTTTESCKEIISSSFSYDHRQKMFFLLHLLVTRGQQSVPDRLVLCWFSIFSLRTTLRSLTFAALFSLLHLSLKTFLFIICLSFINLLTPEFILFLHSHEKFQHSLCELFERLLPAWSAAQWQQPAAGLWPLPSAAPRLSKSSTWATTRWTRGWSCFLIGWGNLSVNWRY